MEKHLSYWGSYGGYLSWKQSVATRHCIYTLPFHILWNTPIFPHVFFYRHCHWKESFPTINRAQFDGLKQNLTSSTIEWQKEEFWRNSRGHGNTATERRWMRLHTWCPASSVLSVCWLYSLPSFTLLCLLPPPTPALHQLSAPPAHPQLYFHFSL